MLQYIYLEPIKMLSTLGKISADDILKYFLIFQRKHILQVVSNKDKLA